MANSEIKGGGSPLFIFNGTRICPYCKGAVTGRKDKRFCCRRCKENYAGRGKKPYRKFKKKTCEECGFIPVHPCQLDVDHIDGNNKNHSLINLKTLCANCHRLKTWEKKDYVNLTLRGRN